nr:hypothetical protein [Ruminococcus sp.]
NKYKKLVPDRWHTARKRRVKSAKKKKKIKEKNKKFGKNSITFPNFVTVTNRAFFTICNRRMCV